ncbi:hypothetical protein K466DRAFT_547043 [Polyporus arcularius HHB13444]|uniref:Uncharacterized protein n=1 Tax=Polyporus arcularius HHB13444 TaxID=1314778 RepID=A0A5C3PFF4_9APHY|nr:hypothetical protein K466DRAFT_547043 [Polyporus arcularius HHB13444]
MADPTGKLTIRDLPPEIFHNILNELGCHDRDAISVCALVCRDWLEISREHLFSELHVPRGLDESFDDLANFLETHPILAGYVRTLSLESLLFSIPPNCGLMPLIDVGLICRLVRAVPHIHGLRLRQLNIAPSPVELEPTHKIMVEHLEYEKSFSNIATTFALLSAFRIEHLDFDPLFEDEECAETEVSLGNKTLDVVSLCVNPFTMYPLLAFKALQQVVPPNMLKSFRYPSPMIHPNKLPVAKFLTDVGQNIVDIDLCPTAKDDYLILSGLPSLQVFRYHPWVPLLAPPTDLPSQQAQVVHFRDSWIPHLPSDLEELVLYIKYVDTDSAADLTPGAETMPLWGLDASLARFRRLKKLTICFPDVPSCVTLERAVAAAAVCFPKAHAKGILDVSLRSWALECRDWDIYGYLRDC